MRSAAVVLGLNRWLAVALCYCLFYQGIAGQAGFLEVIVESGNNVDNDPPQAGTFSQEVIVIAVRDSQGNPVPDAEVTLTAPPLSGASLLFENGKPEITLKTGPDGRVRVRVRRNRVAGTVMINVTARHLARIGKAAVIRNNPPLPPSAAPASPLSKVMAFGSIAAAATVGVLVGTGILQGDPAPRALPPTRIIISPPRAPTPAP
jgi:hypothetical protein